MVVVAAGIRPNIDLAVTSGFTVERAIVVDDQMRTVDDPDVYAVGECVQHRGEVYGLVAPLWEQAVVLADHITGADAAAAYHGSRTATKLKVAGRRRRLDGAAGAGAGHRRAHRLLRTAAGASTSRWSSATRSSSARRCSATRRRSHSSSRPSTAGCRCPRSGSRCCSTSAPRRGGRRRRARATTPRSATATACRKAALVACGGGRLQDRHRGHGQDPGRQGLRLLQDPGLPDRRVGRRWRGRGGSVGQLVRARHSDGQAGADGGDPRPRLAVGVRGRSQRSPRRAPRTRSRRWAWRRC